MLRIPIDLLAEERVWWRRFPDQVLAGVDEAGRGPLAGPVVAGAVTMAPLTAERAYAGPLAGLTDSKQLTPARRAAFYDLLTCAPDIQIGVGWCSPAEIDDLNILGATHLAMRRAVAALPLLAGHVLVDGLPVSGLPCPSTAIVRGDAKSFLIAAASVVAKVLRDRHMEELAARYPAYGFDSNKGYGVRDHIAALFRHGPCPQHRRSFRPVQDALQFLPGLKA
ncbi:MAG: ribonuclease HII [Lentisphaerae bacterium]|nr:ribonuclease HII [Lentisphaerota bacterium]